MKKFRTDEDSILEIYLEDVIKEKRALRAKFSKRAKELSKKKAISNAVFSVMKLQLKKEIPI